MKTFDSSPVRLAVIDTDSGFVQVLAKRLEASGSEYRQLTAAPRTDELVAMRVNAIVVDPAVLGPEGGSFLERVAAELPALGIVVCTGRTSVGQRVRGLRMGADDWVTKPCHPEEVLARVEAVVRRRKQAAHTASDDEPVAGGELEIRPDRFQAFVAGRSVDLTRREFELLALLARAQGRVLQREEIYQLVWGYAMARGDRSVDVFVRKVRQKLEQASSSWTYIHTHFGVGYRFDPEPADGIPLERAEAETADRAGADPPQLEEVELPEPDAEPHGQAPKPPSAPASHARQKLQA